MKRQLSCLLIVLLIAAPALAKDDAGGSVGCPAARAEANLETPAVADRKEGDSARPASTNSAPREQERGRKGNRPRWHSYIPGMIR